MYHPSLSSLSCRLPDVQSASLWTYLSLQASFHNSDAILSLMLFVPSWVFFRVSYFVPRFHKRLFKLPSFVSALFPCFIFSPPSVDEQKSSEAIFYHCTLSLSSARTNFGVIILTKCCGSRSRSTLLIMFVRFCISSLQHRQHFRYSSAYVCLFNLRFHKVAHGLTSGKYNI